MIGAGSRPERELAYGIRIATEAPGIHAHFTEPQNQAGHAPRKGAEVQGDLPALPWPPSSPHTHCSPDLLAGTWQAISARLAPPSSPVFSLLD